MFKVIKANSRQNWENTVLQFANATFLDSWAWGEYQLKAGVNFKRYLIKKDETFVGAIPFSVERAKRAKYLRVEHAPLIDWNDKELAKFVVEFLKDYAKNEKLWYVRVNPQILKTESNEKLLKSLGFVQSSVYYNNSATTQIIDLTQDLDDIMSNFRKSTRERIRQAPRKGLIVDIDDSNQAFEIFSKLYLETVARNRWHAESVLRLRQEFEILRKYNMVKLFLVRYQPDDVYVAASFTVIYNGQIVSLYSGTSSKYRKLPMAYLIRWEHIKYAKSLGLKTYNFWGIAPPNASDKHPWSRLSEFKRGFRGQFVQYIGAWDLPINKPLTYLIHLYEWIRDKNRGYLN